VSVEYEIARLTCDKCGATALTNGAPDCFSDCEGHLTIPAGWTVFHSEWIDDVRKYEPVPTTYAEDTEDEDRSFMKEHRCPACKP